ncbi:hypothetical protein IC582_020853 [Cucumis melo]
MLAFGTLKIQILIEPIFAQLVKLNMASMYFYLNQAARCSIWVEAYGCQARDFLVHHVIALGLHATTLILVKEALNTRGSKFMSDKKDFCYSFPCDGLGRGGTWLRTPLI